MIGEETHPALRKNVKFQEMAYFRYTACRFWTQKWDFTKIVKTRDEKDRPFPGPTRTGLGPDFRNWSVTNRGLGPDWSCPVRSEIFGPKTDFFGLNLHVYGCFFTVFAVFFAIYEQHFR